MKISKKLFLASASVLVLGMGAPSTAHAFDDVNWSWDKTVVSTETIDITVVDEFDISGLVEVEKVQVNIGDVTAVSIVDGIENNAAGEGGPNGGGVVLIDETFTFETGYDDELDPDGIDPAGPQAQGPLDGAILGGAVDEGGDIVNITFQVTGEVEVPPSEIEVLDAEDLPSVESVATAVGNNQSIESTVAVNLHDGQYNMGDVGFGDDNGFPGIPVLATADSVESASLLGEGGNAHTDILAIATIGAALGLIHQGEVSAQSSVSNILNASVDSSATAVGNNLSVDLDANTEGDAFLIADITQFNYANVSASSSVLGVTVNNYTNMGVLEGPLVSSAATAVGNNVSISVSSPEVGE